MRKIYLTILLFFLLSTNSFAILPFKQSKVISSGYSPNIKAVRGINFKPDGTVMYITNRISDSNENARVTQYTLTTPFDINTAIDPVSTNLVGDGGSIPQLRLPHAIEFNTDGTRIFITTNKDPTSVYQFKLTTPWDTTTLEFELRFQVDLTGSGNEDQVRALAFKPDGKRMFIGGKDQDVIREYILTNPFDLTSGVSTGSISTVDLEDADESMRNIQFNSDGTRLYIGGDENNDMKMYTLSTPYDVTTLSSTATTYDLGSRFTEMRGFIFTANFTRLFVTDDNGTTNTIYEYSVECAGTITCNDPTNNDDVKAIIQANVEISNRIIRHNTNSIFHRIEWLRRHKNKDNLTNLNAEVDFSNEVVSNLAKGLASYKSDNSGNLNEEDWFKWSEGRVTLGKRSAINSASKDIHSYGISIGSDKIKDDDPDTMHGYVFQYNNDNVGIGSYGTKLDTNSYSFSLYGTKLRDNQVFTDGIIGIGFLDIDHKRVTFGNRLHGKRRGKQIFGSINLGKRLVDEELNFNPGIKIDLGYTELAAFREKAIADSLTDVLIFKKQEVITGLATIGVLLDKKVKRNDEKIINHHGRLEYIANFSPSSDATVYYANNQSTVYDYKVDNKADRNYRIGYGFDITSISGWSVVANIERFKADDIGHTNEFYLSLGYVPIDGTKFAFDLKNNESTKTGFNISKNVNGYDLKFDYENYLSQSKKGDYLANLSLHKKY